MAIPLMRGGPLVQSMAYQESWKASILQASALEVIAGEEELSNLIRVSSWLAVLECTVGNDFACDPGSLGRYTELALSCLPYPCYMSAFP